MKNILFTTLLIGGVSTTWFLVGASTTNPALQRIPSSYMTGLALLCSGLANFSFVARAAKK